MKFKYFRDPDNFAYKIDVASECAICKNKGMWFDAGMYYGINEIDCICDECLSTGKLKKLDIETNEACDGATEDIETIIYKTPALPTWQSREWPLVNNQYCIFEKIASKLDFKDKQEFISSFSQSDRDDSDLDWLWNELPETNITNLNNGNYDMSVYLFSINNNKYCTWDAS